MPVFDHLDRWRLPLALLVSALTVASIPALLSIRVDNALEVWIDREGEAYREYQELLSTFGSEEFILLVYNPPETLDQDFLFQLTDLGLDLEAIDGVRQVHSLAQVYAQFYSLRGLDAFNEDLHTSPFYRNFLVSEDGRWAAVWLTLDLEGPDDREPIVEAVEAALGGEPVGRPVYLAGSPVINVELDRASRRASKVFFPPVFALSAAVLLLLFRRFYGVVLPFVSVGVGIAGTLAILAATGRTLNMVTVALPPLVWVLGLSTSIHLLSRAQQLLASGSTREQAVRGAMREVWRPCLYSAITTSLGFGSLMASTMEPVREMGLFASLGILLCLASNFLLFPTLARLLRLDAGASRRRQETGVSAHEQGLDRLGRRVFHHPKMVLTVTLVLAVIFAGGLFRLEAEANIIEFFRHDTPIHVTYEEVLQDFTGPYSLEVLLSPGIPTPDAPPDLDTFRRLDRLSTALSQHEEVARVFSAVDLVKVAYQLAAAAPGQDAAAGYRLPATEEEFADLWQRAGPDLEEQLAAFRAPDGTLRVSILARPLGSKGHERLVEEITADLEAVETVEPAWRPRLTGIVPLLVGLQEDLLTSQIRSFAFAFLIIFPAMGLLLRSVRDAALSLLPNLFPVLFALGLMGYTGIALDPATVMIAGIALGISVNDTIHFLIGYRRHCRKAGSLEDAVAVTFRAVGRPMVLTSLVASLGFFVLCLADFLPLFYFGLLMGITLGAALLSDLLTLPALLAFFDRRGTKERCGP